MSHSTSKRCGFVALTGRPNVGKSTLLNHILKQKISITSRKPQTTRKQILGIHTEADSQCIFIDTPGQHLKEKNILNRYMNQVANHSFSMADVVVVVIDCLKWTAEDQLVMQRLANANQKHGKEIPTIIAINKIDRLHDKNLLLPYIERLQKEFAVEIVPIAALTGNNLEHLHQQIIKYLPLSDHIYPEDQVTSHSQRFLCAEIIREKIIRQIGDEIPHRCSVIIEKFQQKNKTYHLDALIVVERAGQKNIIIGSNGSRIKLIGTEARKDIQVLVDSKVMLTLWVKVRANWTDNNKELIKLGYD